jgi:hypothetical protein
VPPSWMHPLQGWKLAGAIDKGNSRGATALGDALTAAPRILTAARAMQRVIFVLSDGEDNASDVTPEAAGRTAISAGENTMASRRAVGECASTNSN